jgi:hypothetical protein
VRFLKTKEARRWVIREFPDYKEVRNELPNIQNPYQIDFRLPWIMKNYPNAKILHIHRNPRDQWCSVLGDFHSYPPSVRTREGFQDRFYHCSWVRDLSRQFPSLEDYATSHQYYTFYFLWKLSFVFGDRFADLSITMEKLAENPRDCLAEVIKATGADLGLENLDLSFVNQASSRWQEYASDDWFTIIETECERILGDFFFCPGACLEVESK